MGSKVQNSMGMKTLAQIAVVGRKRMGRRKSVLKQQPHGITLVAHAGLDRHQHVAKLSTEHKNRTAITQLPSRCRAPGGFNLCKPWLLTHVIIGRDQCMDIGISAVLLSIAMNNAVA